MTPTQLNLMARLAEALAERFSSAGHPMQIVTNERLGYCTVRGCAPSCHGLRALLTEAVDVLERETERPVQMALREESS